jgi:uncharacterized membrane protein
MRRVHAAFGTVRLAFVTGIARVFPVFLTVYVVFLVFAFVNNIAGSYCNALLRRYAGFEIPFLGLILAVLVVLGAGAVSRNWAGRTLFHFVEQLLKRTPVVTSIYPSAKQLSDFLFGRNGARGFREVVIVEYPQPGAYALGFVTNEEIEVIDRSAGEPMVSVFVPLTPSPFSGIILLQPRDRIRRVNVPAEQAIKFIVSGGIVAPGVRTKAKQGTVRERAAA